MTPLYEQCNSLGELLSRGAARWPDKPAVVSPPSSITFHELNDLSNRIAGYLRSRGIGLGARVGLYCSNSHWFVASYFGIIKTGASVVPLNLLYSAEEIHYILADSGAAGLIYLDIMEQTVGAICGRLPDLKVMIGIGTLHLTQAVPLTQVALFPAAGDDIQKVDQKEDVAAIIYTSGTTGRPKGAMLTHRNLLFNVNSALQVLFVEENDVFLTVLPMFHAFAATAGTLVPLAAGATVAAVPRFMPEEAGRIIQAVKATIFMGVPSMYALFAGLPESRTPDLSCLRFCVSGGAALPAEVMKRFEDKYKVLIYEGDGPTECSPVTAVNPIGGLRKSCSIGLPVPGVEMKIVDEKGDELPHGKIGEIVVKAESVMKGYFKRLEDTKESFFGEWFRTGDLGHEDDDGYFFIVDRKKDIIIVNGMNVYPRMVEEVISRMPEVAEVAVVPEPHPLHGEVPRAVIALKEGATLTAEDVRRFCGLSLGRHEVPRVVEFMSALPKTPTGKIVKRALLRT